LLGVLIVGVRVGPFEDGADTSGCRSFQGLQSAVQAGVTSPTTPTKAVNARLFPIRIVNPRAIISAPNGTGKGTTASPARTKMTAMIW
tara:strand:- start:2083 stop:2346 length:264 start_codon:yes stop_codon:yes gene_type:complete